MKKNILLIISLIGIGLIMNVGTVKAESLNGLISENGKTYYYSDGVKMTGFQLIDGKTYFFSRATNMLGEMRTGFIDIDNDRYYFDENGVMALGFKNINGKTYFFSQAQEMLGKMRTGFIDVDGKTYFLSRATNMLGEMRTGLLYIDNQYYGFGTDGTLQKNKLVTINNKTYYFNENGIAQVGFQVIDGEIYFFSRATNMWGEMRTGLLYIDNQYYGFGADGTLQKNKLVTINNKTYYFNENGIAQVGFQVIDGKTYFFSRATNMWGEMRTGFVTVDDKTYFFSRAKEMLGEMRTGFIEVNGKKYYLDESGVLALGFQTIDDKTYFFSRANNMLGEMRTGFITVDDKTYYMNAQGIMITGYYIVDGKCYYFDENGVMDKTDKTLGFININGKTYFIKIDGNVALGFQTINGKTYFFSRANNMLGEMRTGFITIDNNLYYFDNNGIMAIGWQNIDGYQYYFDITGKAARDWIKIDGVKCFFNSLGQLIGKNVKKVIDVSAWQDIIDWDQVKNSGDVDGVILRVAAGSSAEDSQLGRNIAELNRLGIPYGLYIYSYAENEQEAIWEAERVISAINKYNAKLSYPIYMDLEANEYTNSYTPNNYLPIVRAFMNRLKQDNYSGKIYTYTSWANTALNHPELLSQIDWIAQYWHNCSYTGNYSGWQYSSTERIPGITTNVDVNVWFK